MNIALVGAGGFVGSHLSAAIEECGDHSYTEFRRGDSLMDLSKHEVVIHTANPAQRFKAEQNPSRDFRETVEKTTNIIELSGPAKIVLISSISCRTQLDTNYGRNRRACELLVLSNGGSVIRLGPMFSTLRVNDTLHDILLGKDIYLSSATRYAYVSADWVAKQVVSRLELVEKTLELGAKDTVTLRQIANEFGSPSKFIRDYIDDQYPMSAEASFPSSSLVYEFARRALERIKG